MADTLRIETGEIRLQINGEDIGFPLFTGDVVNAAPGATVLTIQPGAVTAADCEKEAYVRAIVGQGATPTMCLRDGEMGAEAGLGEIADGERRIIVCRR